MALTHQQKVLGHRLALATNGLSIASELHSALDAAGSATASRAADAVRALRDVRRELKAAYERTVA